MGPFVSDKPENIFLMCQLCVAPLIRPKDTLYAFSPPKSDKPEHYGATIQGTNQISQVCNSSLVGFNEQL
jgi:hypothetical protein